MEIPVDLFTLPFSNRNSVSPPPARTEIPSIFDPLIIGRFSPGWKERASRDLFDERKLVFSTSLCPRLLSSFDREKSDISFDFYTISAPNLLPTLNFDVLEWAPPPPEPLSEEFFPVLLLRRLLSILFFVLTSHSTERRLRRGLSH